MPRLLTATAVAALVAVSAACANGQDLGVSADSGGAVAAAAPTAKARAPVQPRAGIAANRTAVSGPAAILEARIAALVRAPDLRVKGSVGITVIDDEGRTIYESDGHTPLVPASTQKIVTAAAALLELGPDHRFVTHARATQPPGEDGTVDGDIVLVGSGDPALATDLFQRDVWPMRPRTELEVVADGIAAAGVKRVTGGVVGDPTVFADERLAAGWEAEYLRDLDATHVSGLTVNAGRRLFKRDGMLVGEPAEDPAAEAAATLRHLLKKRGVKVAKGARSSPTPVPAPAELASVESPPLSVLLAHTIQESDNHMADGIFRALGAQSGAPSTWQSSAEAVEAALGALGLDVSGLVFADGSGLSRSNRLTPDVLARISAAMYDSPQAGAWRESLAVMGHSGTLRRRLRGTPAEGRTRGKTGTLDEVRALAGTVESDTGPAYHFAVVGNELTGGEAWTVRMLQDEVVLAIAALEGCPEPAAAVPGPGATPSPGSFHTCPS